MSGKTRIGRGATRKRCPREVVQIDQQPLRRAAGSECGVAMARLEELRAAWNRFEREDKPSFVRWRAREFGPVLSELREVEGRIRDYEALIHEVEMEMRRGFYDPQSAYQRVMFRRESGAPVPEGAKPRAQSKAGEEPKLSEFEQEALFQEWVRKFIGTNPDKLDDKAYSTTFEAFKSHMFRPRPTETPGAQNPQRAAPRHTKRAEETPATAELDSRVKELYRLLVRRLHPDLRADGSATVSALWHEVQEAYAATDIAHLEILLALSDIESDRFSDQTSVSQMRAVLKELERAVFALEDSLRQARNENAWNFARAGAKPNLRAEVEKDLQITLKGRSERLALLKQTIAEWSRPRRAAQ
jgi:hypothetical protein